MVGFALKNHIKQLLEEQGREVIDKGAFELDADDDYPDMALEVARAVSSENATGFLFCRSSAGMVITANKIKNIRAVSAFDEKAVQHAREHNDANILALSADWLTTKVVEELVLLWLSVAFSGEERHQRRINKISRLEQE